MSRHTDWSASVRARRGPRDQRVWVRAWQLVCARVRGGRAGEASASLAEGRRPRRACARAARAWARRLTGGRAVSGFHVAPPWTPAVKIPRERATPSSWRGEARAGAVVPPPCVSHRRASDAARQHCCCPAPRSPAHAAFPARRDSGRDNERTAGRSPRAPPSQLAGPFRTLSRRDRSSRRLRLQHLLRCPVSASAPSSAPCAP